MRNMLIIVGVAVVAALVAAWYLTGDQGARPPADPAEHSPPAPAASVVPHAGVRSPAASGAAGEVEEKAEALPPGLTAEEAERRRRLLALERAAQARFSETVELDGLQAEQVRPAVRALFESMTLEPAFDVEDGMEGYVNGLRIAELSGRNPLARAGFRTGDRLTRLDGQPLVDPAQIAYTMTSLGDSFEVCADRNGAAYCRIVSTTGS